MECGVPAEHVRFLGQEDVAALHRADAAVRHGHLVPRRQNSRQ